MTEIKGQAFILKVTAAQEADTVVRLLLKSGEQITAFAKSALKSKKRFGGAMEPLLNVDFRATKKSSHQNLYYLEETQARHDFPSIKNDMERLAAASYAAELATHSSHEGLENPEIYNLFGAVLKALDSGLPTLKCLRQYEVKLLSCLGWLPTFNRCGECGASGQDLTLNAAQGIVTCEACGIFNVSISEEIQNSIRHLLTTSILKSDISENEAQKVEKVTTSLLQAHWGQQKLKSLQFLNSLRRFQK